MYYMMTYLTDDSSIHMVSHVAWLMCAGLLPQEYAIRVPLFLTHKLDKILKAFVKSGRAAKMQKNLECAWRLHWWTRPHGRAFELTMCELKRRLLGGSRVNVDFEKCAIECGDGEWINLKEAYNNV